MKVFISYSRKDSAIADRLVADLEARSFEVVIDRRDLPYGEEWEAELAGFIRKADTVIWLVSPESVRSRWCNWELGEVQRVSKRLIPVRIGPVAPEELPEALGRIHVLPVEGVYDPALHLDALIAALETDRSWIEAHTRYADRATDWVRSGRRSDRLLRGRALSDAEAWRDRRSANAPALGGDTLDLLLQSRRAATSGLRRLIVLAAGVAVSLAGLAVVAVWQTLVAREQRDLATDRLALSEQQRSVAVYNETVGLNAMAEASRFINRPVEGAMLALAAWPRVGDESRPMLEGTIETLSYSLPWIVESRRILNPKGYSEARYAPTMRYFALRPTPGPIEIWNEGLTQKIAEIGEPEALYYQMALSPDGSLIATKSDDGDIVVFSVKTHAVVSRLAERASVFDTLSFSPDGRSAVVGLEDKSVIIWNIQSGELEARIPARPVYDGADVFYSADHPVFSPDGRYLLTRSTAMELWDRTTGELIKSFDGELVADASFLPHTTEVLFATTDGAVAIWNYADGTVTPGFEPCSIGHHVTSLVLSPIGDSVAFTCDQQTELLLYSLPDLGLRARLEGNAVGGRTAYSLDGKRIAAVLPAGLEVWSALTGELIVQAAGHSDGTTGLLFSNDGNVLTTSWDGTSRIWSVASRGQWRSLGSLGGAASLRGLSITPDGKTLVGVGYDLQLESISIASGKKVASLPVGSTEFARVSPDGKYLVALSLMGDLKLYDLGSGATVAQFDESRPKNAAISPDNAMVAVTLYEGVGVWRADGTRVWGHYDLDLLDDVMFSPDGQRVLTTPFGGGNPVIWDAKTGQRLVEFGDGTTRVDASSFSPDGEQVLSTGYGSGVVWTSTTGKKVFDLKGIEWADSGYFSADGTRLITANGLYGILWDSKTGAALSEYGMGPDRIVGWANLTPDGRTVVTVSDDGEVRAWPVGDVGPGNVFQVACARLANADLLDEIVANYGLTSVVPVCSAGHEPLAPDLSKVMESGRGGST